MTIAEMKAVMRAGKEVPGSVGEGMHRVAVKKGNLVYKLPKGKPGKEANKRELAVWRKAVGTPLQQHLVPVVDMIGDVLVMEYGGITFNDVFQNPEEELCALEDRLGVPDLSPENVTLSWRILDYAGFY